MREAFFSKEAIEYLKEKYPHITESMFNGLLNQFGLAQVQVTTPVGEYDRSISSDHKLIMPAEISNALGIDCEIVMPSINALYYQSVDEVSLVDALTYAYQTLHKQGKSLLTIELEDETSVPKVIYKGEEVTKKVHVGLDWETSTESFAGGLTYSIEHFEFDEMGNPIMNRIERRVKGHATN